MVFYFSKSNGLLEDVFLPWIKKYAFSWKQFHKFVIFLELLQNDTGNLEVLVIMKKEDTIYYYYYFFKASKHRIAHLKM